MTHTPRVGPDQSEHSHIKMGTAQAGLHTCAVSPMPTPFMYSLQSQMDSRQKTRSSPTDWLPYVLTDLCNQSVTSSCSSPFPHNTAYNASQARSGDLKLNCMFIA